MPKYDIDYFIAKFEAIPRESWCEGDFTNRYDQHCALGFCDMTSTRKFTDEGIFLRLHLSDPIAINDGLFNFYKLGKHPRTRILRALRKIKKGGRL